MILLVDNYDSFSYNLYQLIGAAEPDIKVIRNDEMTCEEIEKLAPEVIVLSPGPGKPADAGICVEAVKYFKGKIPIFGVCLGHQSICEAYGATVSYASRLMHGKTSEVALGNAAYGEEFDQDKTNSMSDIVKNMGHTMKAARYHSLSVVEETLPPELVITGRAEDGEVMSVEDTKNKVYGLQFHPESVLTPRGDELIANLLRVCRG